MTWVGLAGGRPRSERSNGLICGRGGSEEDGAVLQGLW